MLAKLILRGTIEAERRAIEQTSRSAARSVLTGLCRDEGDLRPVDTHGRCASCGRDNVEEVAYRWVSIIDALT